MEISTVENCVNYSPDEIKFDPNEPLNNLMISIIEDATYNGNEYKANTLYRGLDAVKFANDLNADSLHGDVFEMKYGFYEERDYGRYNNMSLHIINSDNSIDTAIKDYRHAFEVGTVQYSDQSALETALHDLDYLYNYRPKNMLTSREPIIESLSQKYKNKELPSLKFNDWPEEDKIIGKTIQYNDFTKEDLEHAWKERDEFLNPSFSKLVKDTVKESVNDMKESIKEKTSLVINKIKGNDGLSR